MDYTRIPETAFKNIQMNAGILVTGFNPATGIATGQLGATTGGINFTATPTFSDYGDDIDNCPKNTMELKKLDSWEVTMSGTFVTADTALAKKLIAAADIDGTNANLIKPRNDLASDLSDFEDLWWIGDYSDVNTGANAGYCAVHMLNALSTGGFQIQSTDKGKGNFAFTFTGHYSMANQTKVPFEVYIKGSEGALVPSVQLDTTVLNVTAGSTAKLTAKTVPADATVTWTIPDDDSSVATITADTDTHSATVSGVGAGSTIATATIQPSGSGTPKYTATCTIIVAAG